MSSGLIITPAYLIDKISEADVKWGMKPPQEASALKNLALDVRDKLDRNNVSRDELEEALTAWEDGKVQLKEQFVVTAIWFLRIVQGLRRYKIESRRPTRQEDDEPEISPEQADLIILRACAEVINYIIENDRFGASDAMQMPTFAKKLELDIDPFMEEATNLWKAYGVRHRAQVLGVVRMPGIGKKETARVLAFLDYCVRCAMVEEDFGLTFPAPESDRTPYMDPVRCPEHFKDRVIAWLKDELPFGRDHKLKMQRVEPTEYDKAWAKHGDGAALMSYQDAKKLNKLCISDPDSRMKRKRV